MEGLFPRWKFFSARQCVPTLLPGKKKTPAALEVTPRAERKCFGLRPHWTFTVSAMDVWVVLAVEVVEEVEEPPPQASDRHKHSPRRPSTTSRIAFLRVPVQQSSPSGSPIRPVHEARSKGWRLTCATVCCVTVKITSTWYWPAGVLAAVWIVTVLVLLSKEQVAPVGRFWQAAVIWLPLAAPLKVTVSLTACPACTFKVVAWAVKLMLVLLPLLELSIASTNAGDVPLELAAVTCAVPTEATSAAVIVAVNCVPLTTVVERAEPFHCTAVPEMKFVPFTVSVKAEWPAVTTRGLILLIEGAGVVAGEVALTVAAAEVVGL